MSKDPHWLTAYSSNTYSQAGEDGVIRQILSLLPATDRWCVEFGAWDGVHLSNVRRLILEENYHAVLVEANVSKFRSLVQTYAGNENVQPVNAFVSFDPDNGLDRILASHRIPKDFDFLSIDIDGNDYHVWGAIEEYRPKIVCIEFNPTIPSEVDFVQARDPRTMQGASLLALDRLARAKQYELVCALPFNAFFTDRKYFERFEIEDNRPEVMRRDLSAVTWLFSGYDGTVHLAGAMRMPWHALSMVERRAQMLPRLLRAYPDNYSLFQRGLFRLLKILGVLRT